MVSWATLCAPWGADSRVERSCWAAVWTGERRSTAQPFSSGGVSTCHSRLRLATFPARLHASRGRKREAEKRHRLAREGKAGGNSNSSYGAMYQQPVSERLGAQRLCPTKARRASCQRGRCWARTATAQARGGYSNTYIRNLEKWYWRIYLQSNSGETDIDNRLTDIGRGEERVRRTERVTWKLILPYGK